MDFNETFRKAKEMGVHRLAASRMRKRYLAEMIEAYEACGSDVAMFWARKAKEEIDFLEKHENFVPIKEEAGRITDEMIESARNYPIANLIHFNRNKVSTAWCHPDKRPSLVHLTRINRVWCPVCDQKFDPIKVLMTRDGYAFKDAVLRLCS